MITPDHHHLVPNMSDKENEDQLVLLGAKSFIKHSTLSVRESLILGGFTDNHAEDCSKRVAMHDSFNLVSTHSIVWISVLQIYK